MKDLAEFKRFLVVCRKQGVTNVTWGEVTVAFGDLPRKQAGDVEDAPDPETDGLTEEQLAFYSAGGVTPP